MANSPRKETNDIVKVLIDEFNKRRELAHDAFDKVDETLNRHLTSALTHYYFILSVNGACIAFVVSLTINKKIMAVDCIMLVSMICWLIAFLFGLISINRTQKMMQSFSYYIIGQKTNQKEITEEHKKILDNLGEESAKVIKQPTFWFIIGVLLFMIWYIVKIVSN